MLAYFYTGECEIESNDIVEFLELCQEYLLPDFKQLLEQLLIRNIDLDNFAEVMSLARQFDCRILKEHLYWYGQKNFQLLHQKGGFVGLHKEDWVNIKQPAN